MEKLVKLLQLMRGKIEEIEKDVITIGKNKKELALNLSMHNNSFL